MTQEPEVVQVTAWRGDASVTVASLPTLVKGADRYQVTLYWPDDGTYSVGEAVTYESAVIDARARHAAGIQ